MMVVIDSMKVIERDSSGFLSARTFDDTTDRRSKDPFSRSTPGDRWSELRSGGRSGGVSSGGSNHTENSGDDPSAAGPGTPTTAGAGTAGGTGEDRDDDWRSVRRDRQRKYSDSAAGISVTRV